MKALWACVLVLASAATLSATQYSYSNNGGGLRKGSVKFTLKGASSKSTSLS